MTLSYGAPGVRYSADASALIDLVHYHPQDVFPGVWELLERLASEGRFVIAPIAADECQDEPLKDWIAIHPDVVLPEDTRFNTFTRHFILDSIGQRMVNPQTEKHKGDPFVIIAALMQEGRDPKKLRVAMPGQPICHVLTHEKRSSPTGIPVVAHAFELEPVTLVEMFRAEGAVFR